LGRDPASFEKFVLRKALEVNDDGWSVSLLDD
jgi:hypothetical protein